MVRHASRPRCGSRLTLRVAAHQEIKPAAAAPADLRVAPAAKKVNITDAATDDEMVARIIAVFNTCCPTRITLDRQLDPTINDWAAKCTARVIGAVNHRGKIQLMCEWPVGSGVLYNQGALATNFVRIYAAASGSFSGEPTPPNAWKDLIVLKQEVNRKPTHRNADHERNDDRDDDDDDDQDDEPVHQPAPNTPEAPVDGDDADGSDGEAA